MTNNANSTGSDWIPIVVLPNLDMAGLAECDLAAIVSPHDPRVAGVIQKQPSFATFLNKFQGQFGDAQLPAVLLLRQHILPVDVEVLTGFRDLLAISTILHARAVRLRYKRSSNFAFSVPFQFYPWMSDVDGEGVRMFNAAERHYHELKKFNGQSFPEQSPAHLSENDIDVHLRDELIKRWLHRFFSGSPTWEDRALFRSLNMAHEACRIPALIAETHFDIGRSVALWVSAYEILVHPENEGANKWKVYAQLENMTWFDKRTREAVYDLQAKPFRYFKLASCICKTIYGIRDDYLHGNPLNPDGLRLNDLPLIDFAACLYRMLLAGFLNLGFKDPPPTTNDQQVTIDWMLRQSSSRNNQIIYEQALAQAL